jgi:hypothetical protein
MMKLSRTLQIAVATAVCTAAAAQSALAGGEPKNTSPFTRPATGGRSSAGVVILSASAIANARAAIARRAKNEQPFTRRSTDADALARYLRHNSQPTTGTRLGEPKNQAPFTLRTSQGG